MNVLIVGGGIGGLSLAVGLRNRDIDVELVEIQKSWSVHGVGIIQQCNVVRAMAQLGLLDSYLNASFSFDFVGMYSADGSLRAMIPGQRLAGPEYPANLGISRIALHDVLVSAAGRRGAMIRLGLTVESLQVNENNVAAKFTDGSEGVYDLVVGADGIYSKVRSLVFGDALVPRFTGQAVWRYNFSRPGWIDHLAVFAGPHGNAGLVPLNQNLMYMFVTSYEPGNPRMPADKLHPLMRERLRDFGGIIAELREQISDPGGVVYKPLEVIFVPPPWYRDRVILIGDAAHSTTPHLGQGAGMAVEDAVVLSEELAHSRPTVDPLNAFMARRFERCKFIVEASIQVGEWEMHGREHGDDTGMVRKMLEVTAQPI
jgi:2-polyprenyl-6-methoxyphenol hydroxylase-like FAD-dependent oxidoreductase